MIDSLLDLLFMVLPGLAVAALLGFLYIAVTGRGICV